MTKHDSRSTRVARALRWFFGGIFIVWPLFVFGVVFCDDPSTALCRQPIYSYSVYSTWGYPFYFILSLLMSTRAERTNAEHWREILWALVPALSVFPWLTIYMVPRLLSGM